MNAKFSLHGQTEPQYTFRTTHLTQSFRFVSVALPYLPKCFKKHRKKPNQ